MKLRKHLGDVARAIRATGAQTDEECARVARLLGFDLVSAPRATKPAESTTVSTAAKAPKEAPRPLFDQTVTASSESWLQSVANSRAKELPQWYRDATTIPLDDEIESAPSIQPLFPIQWIRGLLRDSLVHKAHSNDVDVHRLVEMIARRDPVLRLPHRMIAALQFGAQIIVDIHHSMRPYSEDQLIVVNEMKRLLGRDQVEVVYVDGDPRWCLDEANGDRRPMPRPRHRWSVLVLSNLATGPEGSGQSSKRQSDWIAFSSRLQQLGHSVVALTPGSIKRIPPFIRHRINTVAWDLPAIRFEHAPFARRPTDATISDTRNRHPRRALRTTPDVVRLARYLSLASRIPRALLRRARLEFFPESDAGLEAELWFSSIVQTRSPDSILLFPEVAKELQKQLLESGELHAAWKMLESFHPFRPKLPRLQEQLTWLSLKNDAASSQQLDNTLAAIIKSIVEQGRDGLSQWALAALKRTSLEEKSERAAVLRAVSEEMAVGTTRSNGAEGSRSIHETARAIIATNSSTVDVGLFQIANQLRISEPPEVGAEILQIARQATRRIFVNDKEISWNANEPPLTIDVEANSVIQIRAADIGEFSLVPIAHFVGNADPRNRPLRGFVSAVTGEVAGPAFAISPTEIVTTKRTLAASSSVDGEEIEVRFSASSNARARLRSAIHQPDLESQREDELIVLDVVTSPIEVPGFKYGTAQEGAIVYALGCSPDGEPRWARFQAAKVDGESLRLQPLGMMRWLEQQSWSGSLVIDSQTTNCLGFVVAKIGGLVIETPRTLQPQRKEEPTRTRPPRLHLTYDIETDSGLYKKELPFVVGVVGDFCGAAHQTGHQQTRLRDRRFIDVDRDNLDAVIARLRPSLSISVRNHLADDDREMKVALVFARMDDFHPTNVARQIEPLNHLLQSRSHFLEWLNLLDVDEAIGTLITENIVSDSRPSAGIDETTAGEEASRQTRASRRRPVVRLNHSRLRAQLAERRSGKDADKIVSTLAELIEQNPPLEATAPEIFIRAQVKRIDDLLSRQVAEVMHHPGFQQLEGSWRGAAYLVYNTETGFNLRIRLLHATKRDLIRDCEAAIAFDESMLFHWLYESEFGIPGGSPFGVLVADYTFSHSADDTLLLQQLSQVAAAAFCPVITAADARLFGMDSFEQLHHPRDLKTIFETPEYIRWKSLRDSDDARYIMLTLPRILARLPYGEATKRVEEFAFEELPTESLGGNHDYCWMNAAYAYAVRMTYAFSVSGICRSFYGAENGGRVDGLPTHVFRSEDGDLDLKCPTEIQITDRREKEISDLGLQALCHYKNTDYAVFFGATTLHRPKLYPDPDATSNARVASTLSLLMVASRFAHYIKVIARDKLGSFMEKEDLEKWITRWINNYVNASEEMRPSERIEFPLREARVQVNEMPGFPGEYTVSLSLLPDLPLQQLTTPVRFEIRVPKLGG